MVRISIILIIMVLSSISLVSGLSFVELSRTTEENASIRIDRAARAAVSILAEGTGHNFRPVFDRLSNPASIRIDQEIAFSALAPSSELDSLVKTIGQTNQGAANLFRWSPETLSFDRFATTFTAPDGSPPPAFAIRRGHPAFANLAAGQTFIGNVPVQGRLRLAYLTPILTTAGKIAGALAVDVGWVDDLTMAENRLKSRICARLLRQPSKPFPASPASMRS